MNRDTEIAKLEVLLDQAVSGSNEEIDVSSLDAFCHIIKDDPDLNSAATRIIASRIQSLNVKESLFALDVLEECMDSLGSNFQIECNKFKFLNELIRLVSKKFLGDKTPREIQERILDILFTWTDKYPELNKVKEAYTMLRTQGVLHEPQKNVIKASSKKSTDTQLKLMESDKFKRLLQSKNQKDVAAANLMIQNMVRDNDRRMQMQNRRLLDLQSANENSILLKEMLDEFDPADTSEDMLSTLKEIYNNCVKLKPTVMRLAEDTNCSESFVNKVVETNEALNTAIELYTAIIINKSPVVRKIQISLKTSNLLDVDQSVSEPAKPEISGNEANGSLSELNDIFSSSTDEASTPIKTNTILTPTSIHSPQVNNSYVVPTTSNIDLMALINNHKAPSAPSNDIFNAFKTPPASPAKVNTVEKPKAYLSELDSIVSGMKTKLMEADEPESTKIPSNDSDDDVNNLISEDIATETEIKISQPEVMQVEEKVALKGINLDINDIQPSENEPPRTILDEKKGLKVVVNFTNDRPAKDVIVLVITVINQGPMAISNFQFDGSVSKPCKLRILEASGQELPGVKPFKPPTDTINQVLLLLNPTQLPVNMITILTYNIQDDPDPVKESFEVRDIPYCS